MKVLLSAYACEPNKGSEPGVGWHWAHEIEKLGHEVWVLTRKNNQQPIEDFYKKNSKPKKLNFIYYDVPKWLAWWKRGGRGVRLYYLLWQIGAFFLARKSHKINKFDQAQHITFVTVRQPSFIGLLGIPFILGPVGGGERAPYALRAGFGVKGWVKDFVRDIANFIVRFDPLMHITFFSADVIYVTSKQTKQIIPIFYRHKVKVKLAVGFDASLLTTSNRLQKSGSTPIKLLYVGRFEYWKGMGLGIQAFSKILDKYPLTTLTMVGKGPDEKRWRAIAAKLGIEKKITWIHWVDQKELKNIYLKHDLFLFPSLHDSGGMVVLESLAYGLPVICLDLGGPAQIVTPGSGVVTNSKGSQKDVVMKIAKSIELSIETNNAHKLESCVVSRIGECSWTNIVAGVYSEN